MPAYTPLNWQVGVTACNATNMNHIETQLGAVQYGVNALTTRPQLANNVGIANGITTTYTCTGVGTPAIPSGTKAVLLNGFFTPSAASVYMQFMPHGSSWNNAEHPLSGVASTTNVVAIPQLWVMLDATGKIDTFIAGSGNVGGLFLWIYMYLY